MSSGRKDIIKIGITGKQNILTDEQEEVYIKIKSNIAAILAKNNAADFIGYTSLARGADTIFADVVAKEFKQPLHIILPFSVDQYKSNFTEKTDLRVFEEWITKYGVHKVIDTGSSINEQFKNDAYLEAGQYIAEHCDEMIIVWDKIKPGNQGSTAEILGLIACRRETSKLNIIHISPVNHDKFHDEIRQLSVAADQEATRLKKNYNIVWRSSILLGWTAAICFAINAGFYKGIKKPWDDLFIVAEALLVVSVYVIIRISKNKKTHLRFISQRLKAEKLRLIEIFYDANIKVDLKELLDNNDEELSNLITKANAVIDEQPYTSVPYGYYCVKNLIEGQISYHVAFLFNKVANKIHQYERLSRLITTLFLLNLLLGFISFLVNYFNLNITFKYPHGFSVFAGIFLSASFAAVETILYFREWNMLKKNSSHMIDHLKEKQELMTENCEQLKPDELLKDISVKMLTDNKNWDYIIRGKPDEVKLF